MEGVHCAAGPWFTVHRSGDDWKLVDRIWVSSSKKAERARVEARLRLGADDDAKQK